MTAYTLEISRAADKFFQKHPAEEKKIKEIFENIVKNPAEHIQFYDIKICKGNLDGLMRLKTGKYRTIFKIINDRLIIFLIKIDSRGDVYKN